jgi:hypothetical protein
MLVLKTLNKDTRHSAMDQFGLCEESRYHGGGGAGSLLEVSSHLSAGFRYSVGGRFHSRLVSMRPPLKD